MAAGRTGFAGDDVGVECWTLGTGGDTAGPLLEKTDGLVAPGAGMLPLALFEAGEPKPEPLEALPDGTLEPEAPVDGA
jgi:hypothetical protein